MLQVGNFKCRLSFMDPSQPQMELEQYLECVHNEYNRATCWIISEEFCVKPGFDPVIPIDIQVSPVSDGVASTFDVYVFLRGELVCAWSPPPLRSPRLFGHGNPPRFSGPVSLTNTRKQPVKTTLIHPTEDTLTDRPLFFTPGFFPSRTSHSEGRNRIPILPANPTGRHFSSSKDPVPSGILEIVVTAHNCPPVLPNSKPGKRHNLATFTFCYTSAKHLRSCTQRFKGHSPAEPYAGL